jgi:hypothetical protein
MNKKYHQSNEIHNNIVEKIKARRKLETPWLPEFPISNTNIGESLETSIDYFRRCVDQGGELVYPGDDPTMKLDSNGCRIVANVLESFLHMISPCPVPLVNQIDKNNTFMTWYCFWCGYLDPTEVTNDERCVHCGNQLPKRKNKNG